MPLVDLGLKVVADGEQLTVAWGEVGDDRRSTCPERILVYAGAGQRLVVDEVVKNGRNLQAAVDGDALSHNRPHFLSIQVNFDLYVTHG